MSRSGVVRWPHLEGCGGHTWRGEVATPEWGEVATPGGTECTELV